MAQYKEISLEFVATDNLDHLKAQGSFYKIADTPN